MKVVALCIGTASEIAETGTGAWWDKAWKTGFRKASQADAVWLGYEGFRGDEQADRRHHGGVEKAVCVYPVEHYSYWAGQLMPSGLEAGAFGENLTTTGMLESSVCIGDIYRLGEAVVQVSQPRQPCWKLARRWQVKDLALQVENTGYTGFYFRVLQHGHVKAGCGLTLEGRAWPEWTVERCNQIMHHRKEDQEAAASLAGCPALSGSWKDALWRRGMARGGAEELSRRFLRVSGP